MAQCVLSVEEFKKYYRMPGWGKPLYEMKEAEIPKGEIPSAFDWRDKGKSVCILCLVYLAVVVFNRALSFEYFFDVLYRCCNSCQESGKQMAICEWLR